MLIAVHGGNNGNVEVQREDELPAITQANVSLNVGRHNTAPQQQQK